MNNHEACYQHDVITKFEALISEVRSGQKLGDDHVNAANQLLKSQFENLQGLSTPIVGQGLSFDRFDRMLGYAGYGYYQVLHTGSDHWVTIKAISDQEVHVYDSIFVQPTYYSLKQIAAILHSKSHKINLHLERVQRQIGTVDCGVFAIAFLTDLCHGNDPATCHYAGSKVICNHLIKCFGSGQMVPFPSTPVTKQPAVKKQLNIYCKCRLPLASEHLKHPGKDEPTYMVRCYICENLYHYSCVNMTLQAAKKLNASKELWFCEDKGCEEAFGDLFDSD